MKHKFSNQRAVDFLKELAELPSLEDKKCDLSLRCKFNFSYFDNNQKAGQDFRDWSEEQILSLLNSIKEYCKSSLAHLITDGPLVIYKSFPKNSDFKHPLYVPHQAQWGRFRLGNKVRLAGFIIPGEFHNKPHTETGDLYDKNTFYVVFLDRDHKFYKTEKK